MADAKTGSIRVGTERLGTDGDLEPGTEWRIDGQEMGTVLSEKRSARSLELVVRADRATKDDVLKPLDESAGKLDTLIDEQGTFVTKDRSRNGNSYYLTPPEARSGDFQPRKAAYFLVDDYEQKVVDQYAEEYEIKLKFVPREMTFASAVASESQTDGEWFFDFNWGDISTGSVSQKTKAKSKSSVGLRQIQLHLSPGEAEVFEQNCYTTAATRVIDVPDGRNRSVDNSASGECTVDVTAPNDDTGFLPTDTYHVHNWTTEWLSDAQYRVKVDVMPE